MGLLPFTAIDSRMSLVLLPPIITTIVWTWIVDVTVRREKALDNSG
jgi:hypothetical protein